MSKNEPVEALLEEFSSGGYGSSVQEVDEFFRGHFERCMPCKREYGRMANTIKLLDASFFDAQ